MDGCGDGGIVGYYDLEADSLVGQYESLDPAGLYPYLPPLLPPLPARVLDVGAGSGRDSAWLRGMGYDVVAVEPAAGMRAAAVARHGACGIRWVDSRLPELDGVEADGFDFFLAAAVWMHLTAGERFAAWQSLARVTRRGGAGVVTMRHGPSPDPRRPMHAIDTASECALARGAGFSAVRVLSRLDDMMGRGGVWWETVHVVR